MHGSAWHNPFREGHRVDWDEIARRQEARLPLVDAWWRIAAGRQSMHVADVGCGPGVTAIEYARRVGSTGSVLAVDVSPEAIAHVVARRTAAKMPWIHTMCADIEKDRLIETDLDVIFATNVLHHVDDLGGALRNLRSAGGVLLVSEFDPTAPGKIGPPIEERLSAESLQQAARTCGWEPGPPFQLDFEQYAILCRALR